MLSTSCLKRITKASGLSTLMTSPNLSIYRQCHSRLKLLEDILTVRQASMSLCGDVLHVDGIPLTGSFYDDFKATTLRLCDEIDDCYSVLKQLDINNTIDHRPIGDVHWFFLHDEPVYIYWRRLIASRPLKDIYSDYSFTKPRGFKDDCSRALEKATMQSRRGFTIQRLINAMTQAHNAGWFVVFDTLTISDDRVSAFYDNPHALRDYFRDVGRRVLSAEGRKVSSSSSDCYQYFCVPEYGTKTGRLHFHAVHLMRTLPSGSVDPNMGRKTRDRRQLNSLMSTWPFGFSEPIAVRYSKDAFTRLGWLWPVDASKKPLQAKPYLAIGFYVAKYVNKKSDVDKHLKFGDKKWNIRLRTLLSTLPSKSFRVRMSRGFGMVLPSMNALPVKSLIEMTKLSYDSTPMNNVLRQNARRELRARLAKSSVQDVLAALPVQMNLLKSMRRLTKRIPVSSLPNFIALMTPKLASTDISKETFDYLISSGIHSSSLQLTSKWSGAPK